MIAEVDAALSALLASTGARVRFDLPGPDRVGTPTVSLLLVSVSEVKDIRHGGWQEQRDGRGQVVGRRASARRYRLNYLATAWAADVAAEHVLLGDVLDVLDRIEAVPDEHLTAERRASGEPVLLRTATTSPITMPEWVALGIAPRPVLAVDATLALVRLSQPVEDPPSVIDVGVAGGPPVRPAPAAPGPRPSGRIRESADRGDR